MAASRSRTRGRAAIRSRSISSTRIRRHECMPSTCPDRSLSVIVPAYNEADNIAGTLENVTAALSALALDAEVIVIDDGSSDSTADLVRAHLPRFPAVSLLVNARNLGFGYTYRRSEE